jgi:hypothetical protein
LAARIRGGEVDLTFGLSALAGILLDQLVQATDRDPAALLADIHATYLTTSIVQPLDAAGAGFVRILKVFGDGVLAVSGHRRGPVPTSHKPLRNLPPSSRSVRA